MVYEKLGGNIFYKVKKLTDDSHDIYKIELNVGKFSAKLVTIKYIIIKLQREIRPYTSSTQNFSFGIIKLAESFAAYICN